MSYIKDFKDSLLSDAHLCDYENFVLELFRFQANNCRVYGEYIKLINRSLSSIKKISDIPFLPITLFKNYDVLSHAQQPKFYFLSSGTSGKASSRHSIVDPDFYEQISKKIFEHQYGSLSEYQIFALLPSYLEQGSSSLVYMVNAFIKHAVQGSDFFLHNFNDLKNRVLEAEKRSQKYILWGVSYALLDFAAYFPEPLLHAKIIETGGMKGKRKEMTKQMLHGILKKAWGMDIIGSEYGMTELLSQAYALQDGVFGAPSSMKVLLRDPNDPYDLTPRTRQGGINVIDLANIDSCAFIETQDLGFLGQKTNTFEIAGRLQISDLRGCNLMLG